MTDCHNPECQCSLPESLQQCANLPAEMKVDYIRLYQDPSDGSHTTSCSPPAYPTQQFIEDHSERFRVWAPNLSPAAKAAAEQQVQQLSQEAHLSSGAVTLFLCAGVIIVLSLAMFVYRSSHRRASRLAGYSEDKNYPSGESSHHYRGGSMRTEASSSGVVGEKTALLAKKAGFV